MTLRNIYALLVGIDKYLKVTGLNGCVNDIEAVEDYLMSRYNPAKYNKPSILSLKNEEATRDKVIEMFQKHLSQAGKDDVALFYFCGHGSQEKAGMEFEALEFNKIDNSTSFQKLETIVCYDSRTKRDDNSSEIREIADKELRYLIYKLAKNEPHILVVYDCCHSGSGSRDFDLNEGVRQAPMFFTNKSREYNQFCFAGDPEIELLKKEGNGKFVEFPEGKHVFISACLNTETAKEIVEKKRGAFSYFLVNELNRHNVTLSYNDLIREVGARVKGYRKDQTPGIQAIKINQSLDGMSFLGDQEAITPREPYFILSHRKQVTTKDGINNIQKMEWVINGGAFLNLQRGSKLNVYPEHSTFEQMKDVSNRLGEIELRDVRLSESVVQFTSKGDEPDENSNFYAILTERSQPKVSFYLDGDDEVLAKVQDLLKNSLYVNIERDSSKGSKYRLYARDKKFKITDDQDRLLVKPIEGDEKSDHNVNLAAKQVEHIARWEYIRELKNPTTPDTTILEKGIKIEIDYNGTKLEGSCPQLKYHKQNNEWVPPRIQLKLKNHLHQPLYCTILNIVSDYSVEVSPIFPEDHKSVTIGKKPGEFQGEYEGDKNIPISMPEQLVAQGATECLDLYKLIISTEPLDDISISEFEQPGLPVTLDQERPMGGQFPKPLVDCWITKEFSFTILRPKDEVELKPGEQTDFPSGITIKSPTGLSASVSLKQSSPATRSITDTGLPPIIARNTEVFKLASTTQSLERDLDILEDLDVLELKVDNKSTINTVTPESPIIVSVNQTLQPDEYIIPLAYDGEFFFPLGFGYSENGKTEIRIERLCDPTGLNTDERRVGEAIQICFRKIISKNIGQESSYAWLRKASLNPDGTVAYSNKGDLETVKAAVEKAKNIVLYIHGIFGDTESMIPSVRHTKVNQNGQAKSLEKLYDLVLAFDYESLNTSIKDTAKELKKQLEAVGLQAGHGKTLHIVAHSMGGLVSRSFIELQGGNQVVNHLIMVGTPNGGSEWATVHDLATTMLFLGLNLSSVTIVPWVLEKLVEATVKKLVKAMSVTLGEMHITNSLLLKELKNSSDPKCPYSIIAGNTALIAQTSQEKKLLDALKKKVIEFPFGDEENDIAVTVSSINSLSKERSPAVYIHTPIACNHLSYFQHKEGLNALASVINRAFDYPSDDSLPPTPPRSPSPSGGSNSSPGSSPAIGNGTSTTQINSTNQPTESNRQSSISKDPKSSDANLPMPPFQPQKSDFKYYAVVIGIQDYNVPIEKLETPCNDAREIAKILEEYHGYELIVPPGSNEKAWLDGDATLKNLNELLDNILPNKVTSNDRLLFYYAGHGAYFSLNPSEGPQGYLIPQDAGNGNPKTYLPMKKLRETLVKKLNCRHCLLILDCCHAGAFYSTKLRPMGQTIPVYPATLDWYNNKRAWQVVTSTDYKQRANDSASISLDSNHNLQSYFKEGKTDHSPFALTLIKALKEETADFCPKDGIITAQELVTYLIHEVQEATRDKEKSTGDKKIQTPGLYTIEEKHQEVQYFFFTKYFDKDKLPPNPKLTEENNPYRGWEPYQEKHANKFFGRQKVIEKLCNQVGNQPLTIILGSSGSGKSSLVNAGLIPHLRSLSDKEQNQPPEETTETDLGKPPTHACKYKQWKILPESRIWKETQDGDKVLLVIDQLEDLRQKLDQEISRIWKETQDGDKVLLVIDQLEDLRGYSEEQRNNFLQRLIKELNEHPDQLRLVFALREDFELELKENFEALLKNQAKGQNFDWEQGRFPLESMNEEQIEEVIKSPALIDEFHFEQNKPDGSLVQSLVREVKDNMPGTLPWLSFTLSELYKKLAQRFINSTVGRGTCDREIKWQDYNELRGSVQTTLVSSLVSTKMNEVYDDFLKDNADNKDAFERTIHNLMLRMITVNGTQITNLRQSVETEWNYPNLSQNERVKQVINHFVDNRILVKGLFDKKIYIKPCHKSLACDWFANKNWIVSLPKVYDSKPFLKKITFSKTPQPEREWLGLWQELTNAANNWDNEKRKPEFLWDEHSHLTQLDQISNSENSLFSKLETEFVQESVKRRKRITIRNQQIGATLMGVVLIAFVVGVIANINKISSERESAEKNLSLGQDMDSLIDAVEAGKKLKDIQKIPVFSKLIGLDPPLPNEVKNTLQKTFYQIRDKNRLTVDRSRIDHVAFSPDGQYIATGELDGKVRLWERSGKEVPNFKPFDVTRGKEQYLTSISFSPNSQQLVTLIEDKNNPVIKVLNLDGGRGKDCPLIMPEDESIDKIIISPDNKLLISSEESKYDPKLKSSINYYYLRSLKINQPCSRDLKPGNPLVQFNYKDDKQRFLILSAFSSNGKVIAIVPVSNDSADPANGVVVFKDVTSKKEVGRIQPKQVHHSNTTASLILDFSPDGKLVATVSQYEDDYINLWDLQGNRLAQFPANQGGVRSVRFSPDGEQLASVGEDGTVRIWEKLAGKPSAEFSDKELTQMALSSDGRLLAAVHQNGTVQLWDWQTGELIFKFPKENVSTPIVGLSFSADNRLLAIGEQGKEDEEKAKIHLWNLENRENPQPLPRPIEGSNLSVESVGPLFLKLYGTALWGLSFSHDGCRVATGGSTIAIHSVNGKNCADELKSIPLAQPEDIPEGWIYQFQSTALNSNGSILAAGGVDGQVYLWNLAEPQGEQGKLQKSLVTGTDQVLSLSFHPERDLLATAGLDGSNGVVRVWDLSGDLSSEIKAKKEEFKGHRGKINQVIFSPDGTRLATAGADGTARVWDLSSGQELAQFKEFDEVASIAFSSDSKKLIASGRRYDASGQELWQVKQWQIEDLDQLLVRSCDWVRSYLANQPEPNYRNLCDGILAPGTSGEISEGEKILIPTLINQNKQAGIEAIASGDFPTAIKHLQISLEKNLNDPEARIYFNNAKIGNRKSYTIAVSVPLSSNVNGSLEILRGVAQAQSEFNKEANIPIRVLIADDANDPKVAKQVAQNLAKNPDVLGVVGHFSSGATREAAKVYNNKKLVAISPSSTSVKLSEVLGKYVFRTVPDDKVAAEKLVGYMRKNEKMGNKAIVFYDSQSEYSCSLASEFLTAFSGEGAEQLNRDCSKYRIRSVSSQGGGKVLKAVDLSAPNFDAKKSLRVEGVDKNTVLVLLADSSKLNQSFQVLKANKGRLPILGGDSFYGLTILKEVGKQAKGMVVAVPWHIGNHHELELDFLTKSQELWNKRDINWRTVMSYDAAHALMTAIKENPDRKEVAKTLNSSNFTAEGAIEPVEFSSGDRDGNMMQLVKIDDPGDQSRSGYNYEFVPVQESPESKESN